MLETDDANNVIANKIAAPKAIDPKTRTEDVVEKLECFRQEVVITDFKMPFGSMVVFMVKWAIASIPALIILFLAFSVLSLFFGGIFL